jgi:hypothetical protein
VHQEDERHSDRIFVVEQASGWVGVNCKRGGYQEIASKDRGLMPVNALLSSGHRSARALDR